MHILKKLIYNNLKLNRHRTIVSIIGIMLATALLTALFTIISSMRYSIIEREKGIHGDYHVKYYDVSGEDYKVLTQNRQIEKVYVQDNLGYAFLPQSENEYKPYAHIVALEKDSFKRAGYTLVEGRYPQNASEIVISKHVNTNGRAGIALGDTLSLEVGTRIALDYYGHGQMELDQSSGYGSGGEETLTDTTLREYTVVGIIQRPSYKNEPYSAPGYTFVTYVGDIKKDDCVDVVYVRFKNRALADWCKLVADFIGVDADIFRRVNDGAYRNRISPEESERYCEELDKQKYYFEINDNLISYERLWPVDNMFATLFVVGAFVGLIIVGTSVYCIKNSFAISVSEKVKLYGMLAGIGSTKKQIRRCVLKEAETEGLIGLPLGLILGLGASFILVKVSNYYLMESFGRNIATFHISWVPIAISLVLGILTVFLASIGAAVKAGRIAPIEAIRNSQELNLNSRKLRTPGLISKIWGIGGVISYKSIKRNGRKYRTTVVSIVVCTIAYIVTSYFMSLLFDVARNNYTEEPCNVYISVHDDVNSGLDDLRDLFSSFPKIKKMVVSKSGYVASDRLEYTKELADFYMQYDIDVKNDINWMSVNMDVQILDNSSFAEYAKECRIPNEKGKIIFMNYANVGNGIIKAVNSPWSGLPVYRAVDYQNIYDDDGNEIGVVDIKSPYFYLDIAGTTDKTPVGFKDVTWPTIFMSEDTYLECGIIENIDLKLGSTSIHFIVKDADRFQDELETVVEDNKALFRDDYFIYNRDREAKEEQSFYTLIAIFAYGLITVISLIGITNIVNTLGTGMELRARDFATLRSIGMTRNQFRRMVWLESLFTSAKALVIGITAGLAITVLFWQFLVRYGDGYIYYKPPVLAVIICIAVVLVLVYLIISTSLNKINRRNIIETIKNENI